MQKSLSLTSHVWDGYQILGNRRAWAKLPQGLKDIVARELAASGQQERADIVRLSASLRQGLAAKDLAAKDLAAKGLAVHDVDRAKFRDALKGTGDYKD